MLNASLGLRYGLSASSQIYVRFNGYANESRQSSPPNFTTSRQKGYSSASFGLVQRLYQADKANNLVGFASINLIDQKTNLPDGTSASLNGKSYSLGLSAYHSTDPIVISLSGAFGLNKLQEFAGQLIEPGNSFLLSGGVDFVVNDQINLSGGMQWQHQQPQYNNGTQTSSAHTSTSVSAGLGYAISKSTTAFVSLNAGVSGESGSTINLSLAQSLN